MIFITWGKDRYRWLLLQVLVFLVITSAGTVLLVRGFALDLVSILIYLIRGILLLAFLILARRDLALLFRRPGENLGTGFSRIAAVARTTILEAWAGRIWLLPLLWLIVSFVLIFSVRPFDESERIPLYIKMLLSGQELLVLVILWVMACVSLPRERERKVVITNASKPLSRLEMLLGKIAGFSMASGAMLLVMFVASLLILYVADFHLRGSAAVAYDIQKRDFDQTKKLPSEALKQLSEEGSLFAHNYITIPSDGMNIGVTAFSRDGTQLQRYIIGGTQEKIIYRFFPNLPIPDFMVYQPPGIRPYFVFYFPIAARDPNVDLKNVKIHVAASRSGPSAPQEADLTLGEGNAVAWEPERPEDLFSTFGADGQMIDIRGIVTIEVTCPTPGVLLQVLEGAAPDPVTGMVPSDVPFNVEFSSRLAAVIAGAPDQTFFPLPRPVVRGYERHDRQEVAGPKPDVLARETAIYRFPGKSLANVPVDRNGNFTLAIQLETDKGAEPDKPTIAGISVHTLENNGSAEFNIEKEVLEKRSMKIEVPAASLGDTDPHKRADMIVMVYCMTPGHAISVIETSVCIQRPETLFFLNFFKAELVIFMEALVLISVCVVCSVRLGWPVAMFCSGICVLFGFLLKFLVDLQEYGGLGALNYRSFQFSKNVFAVLDTLAGTTWKILAVMGRAVPNFQIYQFPQEYVPKLINMPWVTVIDNMGHTVGFVVPVIAIGYLLFRKQELG